MTGWIGLGTMGGPMARRLSAAGTDLLVWNRTPGKAQGMCEAASVDELFAACEVVVLMLLDRAALDAVLGRGTADFHRRAQGRTIVFMGTIAPEDSLALEQEIRAAGGAYVEAPVSGSRKPAEDGALVVMTAGEAAAVQQVQALFGHLGRQTFHCGAVPNALRMKLAVNLYLGAMITGLMEAAHFAQRQGLELSLFAQILAAGPMSSPASQVKMAKLVAGDFAAQASVTNVAEVTRLISDAARQANVSIPIFAAVDALMHQAESEGLGEEDVIAVIKAMG